ncbi:hypothetical protein [Arcicella lustrica]|uniref:LPXTG cell wall anchor domain-containing protein n=1 Tax=Arcicella lustrica TaxID=2984196 RepID=A0ABU5SDI9_9BACT|nr:hypothetical protein [Arcicella sp. DC25W]MEA5425358.1 hypothetical protein [Arcicella sp. DC25W]
MYKTSIKQEHSFVDWAKNTENVFIALIAVATFTGLAWGGYRVIKKRKK